MLKKWHKNAYYLKFPNLLIISLIFQSYTNHLISNNLKTIFGGLGHLLLRIPTKFLILFILNYKCNVKIHIILIVYSLKPVKVNHIIFFYDYLHKIFVHNQKLIL